MSDNGRNLVLPPRVPRAAPVLRLAVIDGPGSPRELPLRRAVTLFGSLRGCKIVMRDHAVSGVHCAVINTGDDVYLRDLLSKNGTLLNDLRAGFEKITDGDVMRIGRWSFRLNVASPAAQDTCSDMTGISMEPAPAIMALEQVDTGNLLRLDRSVNLIGKGAGCDIEINEDGVSRAHAIVLRYLGHPALFDLMSETGTRVNGNRVGFAALKSADRIEIGGRTLRIRVADSSVLARCPDPSGQKVLRPRFIGEPSSTLSDQIDLSASDADRN